MPRHKSCICHVGDFPYLNQSRAVQSYNLSFCIFVLAMFCNFDSLVSLHRLVLLSMLTTCRLTCHTQSLMLFLATRVLFLATQMLFLATPALSPQSIIPPPIHSITPHPQHQTSREGGWASKISCTPIDTKQDKHGRADLYTDQLWNLHSLIWSHCEPSLGVLSEASATYVTNIP